jgi:hypothetical protein
MKLKTPTWGALTFLILLSNLKIYLKKNWITVFNFLINNNITKLKRL